MWSSLPDIILEQIYDLLDLRERYACSLVCRHWSEVFDTSSLWRHIHFHERSFTRRRYSIYSGYRDEISHRRLQLYLANLGHHCQTITFEPIQNFYNLFEFLHVLACFLEFFDDYPMTRLRRLYFTFSCETRSRAEVEIIGTGGQVLREIKRILHDVHDLTDLTLNHLLLDVNDAIDLLDDVVKNCHETLLHLEILNSTKAPSTLRGLAFLPALLSLVITPAQLPAESLLDLCAGAPTLEEIVLVDDRFTTINRGRTMEELAICSSVWYSVRQTNPHLRVRLEFRRPRPRRDAHRGSNVAADGGGGDAVLAAVPAGPDNDDEDAMITDGAPVDTIVFERRPPTRAAVERLSDLYGSSIVTYGHVTSARGCGSGPWHRADAALVGLVRSCRRLRTIVIGAHISTATLLVLAREAPPSLRELWVRRNAVLLRRDRRREACWSDEYWDWMRQNARSYACVEREVDACLRHRRARVGRSSDAGLSAARGDEGREEVENSGRCWRLLSDADFNRLNI